MWNQWSLHQHILWWNTTGKRKLEKNFWVPEFGHPNWYTGLPNGLDMPLPQNCPPGQFLPRTIIPPPPSPLKSHEIFFKGICIIVSNLYGRFWWRKYVTAYNFTNRELLARSVELSSTRRMASFQKFFGRRHLCNKTCNERSDCYLHTGKNAVTTFL